MSCDGEPRAESGEDAVVVSMLASALPDVAAIYRFGSSVKGTERPGSDLDLAVLAESPLEPAVRYDLQERIAAAIHRSVDLVDLRRASTVMASQIVTAGVVLAGRDAPERHRFEDRVYSAYARLNEERRGILGTR